MKTKETSRIAELKKQIIEANTAYRTEEAIISDSEYDDLIEELEQLVPNDELLTKIGHTPVDESRKRKLPIPMASMNKIKTIEELRSWIRLKKIPEDTLMIITPKYDGLSLCNNEVDNEAWTRGDGEVGQLSTEHFKFIGSKKRLRYSFYSFGEVIMSKKNWERCKTLINPRTGNPYKNPRNMASGKMNDKRPTDILSNFTYVRYGLSSESHKHLDKEAQLEILNQLNDHKVSYKIIEVGKITTEMLVDLFTNWSCEFELDGVIIEVNDAKLREKLGRETSTNNPCFARAFKGNFEMVKDTVVKSIVYQVSKLGYLKPVTHIEPVELDGATVKKATAINERFVVGFRLHVGSKVKIKRSGMVIPLIMEIDGNKIEKDKHGDYIFPYSDEKLTIKKCPICNGAVSWNESKIEATCTNTECEGSNLQKIIAFFEILEVDDVSDGICEVFFNAGYNSIDKILNMSKKDILSLDGFAEKKAEKTYENIHSKLNGVSLSKLQHASGCFSGLGSKKLLLLEHFEKVPTIAEIIQIEGFSDKSAEMYLSGLDNFNKFIKNLPITIAKTEKVEATSNDLQGKIFVFTGIRRTDLEVIIQSKGGTIGSGVSKNTTHLICKDMNSGSSKLEKAKELGVTIMNVENLEKLLS
jgi:DNA ligase (NAD+)